jgi:RNA polymerase primary sigma factor
MTSDELGDRDLSLMVEQLAEINRERGFVSIDDILAVLPEAENEVEQLEDLLEALETAGINYLEETEESLEEDAGAEARQARGKRKDSPVLINIDDGVDLYFREVGDLPLLKAEEEVDLSKRIERGRMARAELAEGPVPEKRKCELQALVEDGWAAREHLILANSRLVISVAKRYMGRGVPFLDLIQEGNIGLIRATKKFDYKRGYKFSTYATWWIRQAVTRAIADQGRTIRVPVHMGDQINKMLRVSHQMTQRLGRTATSEELAEELDIPAKKIEDMIQVARRPLSLEAPTDADEDSVLADFVEDQDSPAPVDVATEQLMREHLREALNALPAREARIIQLRYGLIDGKSYTLEQVGRKMGVTRERVRQIEAQALRRLRQPKMQIMLSDYVK